MTYLTTDELLDNILSRLNDNSSAMRAKCLVWLNEAMRSIIRERNWEFSTVKGSPAAVVNNTVTMPNNFLDVEYLIVDSYFLKPVNALSEEAAFAIDNGQSSGIGYKVNPTDITLHGLSDAATATLCYRAGLIADYTDSAAATIFPTEFREVLIQFTMMKYYEFDADERLSIAVQAYGDELKRLKRMDNRRKAVPYGNNRYLRGSAV